MPLFEGARLLRELLKNSLGDSTIQMDIFNGKEGQCNQHVHRIAKGSWYREFMEAKEDAL